MHSDTEVNSPDPAAAESTESYEDQAWAPCDVASTAVFRVVIGLTVLAHIAIFLSRDGIDYFFGRSQYNLTYFGFDWVQPVGPDGMRRIYFLMGAAAIGVVLGLLYRFCAVVLFVTFTYTFLCEAALYRDHYYLMCLLTLLLIVIPAHRSFSIDSILVPQAASRWIPNWCRWLLMFQIGIPFVCSGIAKINGDWLQAVPALYWFPGRVGVPLIGPLLEQPATAWIYSYASLVFDLAVVPLLLWRPTRVGAFVAVIAFQLFDSVIFGFDVFQFMMIAAVTIFFPADWPRRIFGSKAASAEEAPAEAAPGGGFGSTLTMGFLIVYVTWQLLFPLRHWVYPGNPAWTNEGQQFAWRMMHRQKRAFSVLYATDGSSGRMVEIPLPRLLLPKQILELTMSPSQLAAVAPPLADWARDEYGFEGVEIRAFVLTSLNGRQPQFLVDPDLDLMTVDLGILPQQGIMPLTEPLRQQAWDIPVNQWFDELDIMLPVSIPSSD